MPTIIDGRSINYNLMTSRFRVQFYTENDLPFNLYFVPHTLMQIENMMGQSITDREVVREAVVVFEQLSKLLSGVCEYYSPSIYKGITATNVFCNWVRNGILTRSEFVSWIASRIFCADIASELKSAGFDSVKHRDLFLFKREGKTLAELLCNREVDAYILTPDNVQELLMDLEPSSA